MINSLQDPLFRRIRLHAEKRLDFTPDTPPGERLRQLKEYLRLEQEMLHRYHEKGDGGLRVAKARTIMIDILIEYLFKNALAIYERKFGPPPYPVAMLALGGYGRAELCPLSDIDVMFLYPKKVKPDLLKPLQEVLTDQILYPMWDLNLKIGHSSRTVKEAITEAKADQQTLNALLEARLIYGSKELYDEFEKTYRRYYRRADHRAYAKERLEDQAARREKYGGSVFLQEPDIKNGVGGLRDYQNILWMAEVRLGKGSLDTLVEKKFLGDQERKHLIQAYDFLLRVRNEVHFNSKRPNDQLSLEAQPGIAWALGYKQRDIFRRVEAFMQDYYRHANRIYQLSKLLEQRLALSELGPSRGYSFQAVIDSRRIDRQKELDGFLISPKQLSSQDKDVFIQDPTRMIRMFRYLQQYDLEPDLDLRVLLSQSIHMIDAKLMHNESANRTFRSILQTRGNVYPTLLLMHESGVLGRFIPEFGDITCLVQHEFYHRYTADIHTLSCIRKLDEVFREDGVYTPKYHQALLKTETPALLYLILLVHDLGKSDGIQSHCINGVRVAEPILKRLGIDEKRRKIILTIVENHLEMARFWQRHDIDDPITAARFADIVGDEDTLRYLYVHTYCDAAGTASSLWNSYKDSLHESLFRAALENLHHEPDAMVKRRRERKSMIYREIIERRLQGIEKDQIDAHFNLLPERYFIHNDADDIILHIRMVHELLKTISEADSIGSLVPVVDWNNDEDQGLTVVNVVTWDRAGLFYKLAGALTVAGVNILSTKAISRNDHITIDTFYVVAPDGGVVQDSKAEVNFRNHLEQALLHNVDLMPAIKEQAHKLATQFGATKTNRLRAPIPAKVEVYHELSLKRTIVEVQANDHLGLLYQLAYAIFKHGYDIGFARISTERGAALDTFYIEPTRPMAISNADTLVPLRDEIERIIAHDEFEAAG
ncbi:bifunctional uridylyltransferase/uridylyl-removing enzyme [Cerasicoccus arenae]|uniref:Bifunctional uridylyltransferase/uridylyl-removing enzyme n=1 Tax=Cerasicoccus arenae TaxID=424488 RepID=A0A8J3GF79_9BACT|nr:bifunctional uridylyltransferase/uridylyl-removing enzyme [Cerasicoccus arenae]